MKQLQQGFGIFGIIGIIGVAAIIAVIGLNIATRSKVAAPSPAAQAPKPVAAADRCVNRTVLGAKWALATSQNKLFSMCVPGGWSTMVDTESDSFEAFMPLAVDQHKAPIIKHDVLGGKDGLTDFFMIFVSSKSYSTQDSLSGAQKSTFMFDDGTTTERKYIKYGPQPDESGFGPVEGEEFYSYEIHKGTRYYDVLYSASPGTPNEIEVVETALKTLQVK